MESSYRTGNSISIRSFKVPGYDLDLIRKTVAEILDQSGLEWAGKRVLVKPNQLGPFPPDSAVVTHPSLIRAVREELRSRGSEVLVGDNPGLEGYGRVEKVARTTGALEAAGEDFVNLSLRPRKVDITSRFKDSVEICSEVLEVDYWISLPKLKTHILTILTGAIKNSYGLVVGADKMRLHAAAPVPAKFGEMIVDVFSIRPPDLVIMDAVVGMEGFGPNAGDPRQIGYILASNSAGAVDLAMCHMTGIPPGRLPTQKVAVERGLAPRSLDEVEVVGELPVLKRFKPPSTLARFAIPFRGQSLIFRYVYRPRFKVLKERCNACGSCARGCPVEAIEVNRYPSFDSSKCIGCYCCCELCPEHAIRLNRIAHFMRGFVS